MLPNCGHFSLIWRQPLGHVETVERNVGLILIRVPGSNVTKFGKKVTQSVVQICNKQIVLVQLDGAVTILLVIQKRYCMILSRNIEG